MTLGGPHFGGRYFVFKEKVVFLNLTIVDNMQACIVVATM
jgi:hypothetical protein